MQMGTPAGWALTMASPMKSDAVRAEWRAEQGEGGAASTSAVLRVVVAGEVADEQQQHSQRRSRRNDRI